MIFKACQFEFVFPRPALVMGIVNVTPDSFSDGGRFFDVGKAVDHALEIVAQGAEILDIGGESSRPGAATISEAEELRRVVPVIRQLARQVKVPISADTTKVSVARAALDVGATIVNDIAAATRTDFEMWQLVADRRAGYVLMHAQGSPATMQLSPHYGDVVREVGEFFSAKLEILLNEVGLPLEQTVLDVGIGFGKNLEHNLQLLASLRSFTKWRRPLLVGVSRKSFIEKLLGTPIEQRLPAALACTTLAQAAGAQIFRTHDVAETVRTVRMAEAILSAAPNKPCSTCGRSGL